jgi:protein-S-isoprenylcysteine O-methyltransferase Ste14
MRPGPAIYFLWIGWALSWLAASRWSTRTEKRVGFSTEYRYRVVLFVGGFLLAVPAHRYEGSLRLWHVHFVGAWICVAGVAVGIAFAWWARIHLGRLWSGEITRKADHRVVDTGPYAIVRHPIYTGLLCAALATAAAKGTILGVLGAALFVTGFWMKARLEEQWLSRELGPEEYGRYRRRVPMLVPFGPRSR